MGKLLIDGDIFAYKASSSVQKDIDWGDGLYTCHAYLGDAIEQFNNLLDNVIEMLSEETLDKYSKSDVMIFFSDSHNFRKHYYADYKSNRKNIRKPTCYNALVNWVNNESGYTVVKPMKYLEADDLIGIYATTYNDAIIISMDKDFKTIPATFFDFGRGELVTRTEAEADRWLAYQILVGDATDGYKGCPSYGPVKAKRLLDKTSDEDLWDTVVKACKAQGMTDNEINVQATMARILRKEDFLKFSEGEIPKKFIIAKS